MANATSERASEAAGTVYVCVPNRPGVIKITDPLIRSLLLNDKIDLPTAIVLHDRLTADAEAARVTAENLQSREHDVMNLCGILGLDAEEQLEPRVREMVNVQLRLNKLLTLIDALHPEEVLALRYFLDGVAPCYSTGIDGGLTAGYGRLDDNGFWQYPLPSPFVTRVDQACRDLSYVHGLETALRSATKFLERVQLWTDTDYATWTANLGCRIRVYSNLGFKNRTDEVASVLTGLRETVKQVRR